MRILVIGSSSFLGGHLRRTASAAGHTVLTAGRSDGWSVRLDLVAEPADRVGPRIADTAPDVVVNCAGATAGRADVLAAANITAVHTLVTALLAWTRTGSGTRTPPRLVHIGSAAEYGGGDAGRPVTEDAVPLPAGLYGATKLGGTRLVELARTAGLDAVALRVFNVVGAGAPEDTLPGATAAQLRQLPGGGSLKLGPLDAVRDFIDARDVADAVLAAAAAPALPHALVNIGSGVGTQARVLVRQLLTVAGLNATVHEDAAGSARSAWRDWQQADISRATADFGWRPRRDLADSVR
ncbi:MAG: NAD-dependent epimerase/dehydratase family protein, partial [Trebonia sp.]